jgi:hypothetical protein
MWGVPKAGGLCVIHIPYALTYWTTLYTFDETRGYQLCHYDLVVAQLVATCFINWWLLGTESHLQKTVVKKLPHIG